MTDIPVKRTVGERVEQWKREADAKLGVPVTDADREYGVARAKECNGLNDVADAIARARAEGAASERAACLAAIKKACPRAHTYASENADVYRAFDAGAKEAMAAIRARGAGGKA